MKTIPRFSVVAFLVVSFMRVASAQEMTKDQWQQAIREATQKRNELQAEVKTLEADVVKLKTESTSLAQQIGRCQEDLLAILGTSTAKEKEFTAFLDRIDGRLNELSKLSNQDLFLQRAQLDTVQSTIKQAKSQKLAALPENDQRIHEEQYRLDMLRDSLKKIVATNEETYIVKSWAESHDCLWNIAKKPKVYDNAFLWPKIWQDNRDQIKNPDIIHPGERLKIPPKSPMTADEKDALHSYWHQKNSFASSKHPISPDK